MSKRLPRKRIKWRPPSLKVDYDLFYFTVEANDRGGFNVEPVSDRPAEYPEHQDSMLIIDQAKFAISITWLSGKPAPDTDQRNLGLIAVMKFLSNLVGRPDLMHMIGVGHVWGAKVELHNRDQGAEDG